MTPADQARLAADWATILQSEWAGLAADREVHDTLNRAANRLAQQAALLRAWPPAGPAPTGTSPTPAGVFPAPASASDDPSRLAGADAPPGSAAADAAPGAAGAAFLAGRAERIAPAGRVAPGLG